MTLAEDLTRADHHLIAQRISAAINFNSTTAVVRKNSIRVSRSHLLQPVLVVQSTEHCLASENVPCRKAMTIAAHRWRRLDGVRNARTKTGVNSSVIVMGDPVRQELFQMSLPKWDQEVQAFPSDRADQSLTDGVCLWRSHRCL